MNNHYRSHRIKCVTLVCVCVPQDETRNIVLEEGLKEIFGVKKEGVAGG